MKIKAVWERVCTREEEEKGISLDVVATRRFCDAGSNEM
jgi:hypothetical protein